MSALIGVHNINEAVSSNVLIHKRVGAKKQLKKKKF